MFVIMTYDVGVERLAQVLKTARKYLYWVQNSVFEGEISDADLLRLRSDLLRIVDEEKDSVTFYLLRTTKYLKKDTIGTVKGEPEIFL